MDTDAETRKRGEQTGLDTLVVHLEAGLQFYNGALADPSSQYAQKVFAEKERLQEAVRRFDRPGSRSSV